MWSLYKHLGRSVVILINQSHGVDLIRWGCGVWFGLICLKSGAVAWGDLEQWLVNRGGDFGAVVDKSTMVEFFFIIDLLIFSFSFFFNK